MPSETPWWDYLLVTASHEKQAEVYRARIQSLRERGLLKQAGEFLTIADPGGKRIGSGGSTLLCLQEVSRRESSRSGQKQSTFRSLLDRLRILILHAGGDSRRLPAYGPVGKIFVPLPAEETETMTSSLFDRSLQSLFRLPAPAGNQGQIVVAAGDALLLFAPERFHPAARGVTALGSEGTPEEASRHGVFFLDRDGSLQHYIQKPAVEEQLRLASPDNGLCPLVDLGLMSFDVDTAAAWLRAFDFSSCPEDSPDWTGRIKQSILDRGLDLYREICCAMGTATTFPHYLSALRSSGSTWDEDLLRSLFEQLHPLPMQVCRLPDCRFLHFGTTRQLYESGCDLLRNDSKKSAPPRFFTLQSDVRSEIEVDSPGAWIEGCRIHAPLKLRGENVLTGVDIQVPLLLPEGACLDILPGFGQEGRSLWFLRCYGYRDSFKDTLEEGASYCGIPLSAWLDAAGIPKEELWPEVTIPPDTSLWTARLFPALPYFPKVQDWLWMFAPSSVSPEQRRIWLDSDRYSAAEIALRADLITYHQRRENLK